MNRGEASEIAYGDWKDNPTLERNATPFQRWYLITRQIVRLAEGLRDRADDIKIGAWKDASVLFGDDIHPDPGDEDYYEEMYTVNISEAKELLTSLTEAKRVLDAGLELLVAGKERRQKHETFSKEPIQ